MRIAPANRKPYRLYFFLYFFNKNLYVFCSQNSELFSKEKPNMNELEKALYYAPSLHSDTCVICGKPATNQHHVVFRSQGGSDGATVSVCGFGNASGCHGLLHQRKLHLRYKYGEWQYLYTKKPTKYQFALAMKGWRSV